MTNRKSTRIKKGEGIIGRLSSTEHKRQGGPQQQGYSNWVMTFAVFMCVISRRKNKSRTHRGGVGWWGDPAHYGIPLYDLASSVLPALHFPHIIGVAPS